MSEVLAEISAEAKRITDGTWFYVQRSISRTAIAHTNGTDAIITQRKHITNPQDLLVVQGGGALELATNEWFNNVDWLQSIEKNDDFWSLLNLNATYPLDYFDEKPTPGLFSGNCWLDQYTAITRYSDNNGANHLGLKFVATDTNRITRLCYPDDPTALIAYNSRYQKYLDFLNESNPTIGYYRGWDWDRAVLPKQGQAAIKSKLGGFILKGIGVNEVLQPGVPATQEDVNYTKIVLACEQKQKDIFAKYITIIDGKANTQDYRRGTERDAEPATDELINTVHNLVKSVSTK